MFICGHFLECIQSKEEKQFKEICMFVAFIEYVFEMYRKPTNRTSKKVLDLSRKDQNEERVI